MPYRFLSLALFILTNYGSVVGQSNVAKGTFQEVTAAYGLTSTDYNYFIRRDSRGFVWISSIAGLYRFDGSYARRYGERDGMVGQNIQSNLFEDHAGRIWFNTDLALNVYHPRRDTITQKFLYNSRGDTLEQGDTKIFYFDTTSQRLWLRRDTQLCYRYTHRPSACQCLPASTIGFSFNVETDVDGHLRRIYAHPWWRGRGVEVYELSDTLLTAQYLLAPELSVPRRTLLTDTFHQIFSTDYLVSFIPGHASESYRTDLPAREGWIDVYTMSGADEFFVLRRTNGVSRLEIRSVAKPSVVKRILAQTSQYLDWLRVDTRYAYVNIRKGGILIVPHRTSPFSEVLRDTVEGENLFLTPGLGGSVLITDRMRQVWQIDPPTDRNTPYPLSLPPPRLRGTNVNRFGEFISYDQFRLVLRNATTGWEQVIPNPANHRFGFYLQLSDGRQLLNSDGGILELIRDPATQRYTLQKVPEFADFPPLYSFPLFAGHHGLLVFASYFEETWIYRSIGNRFEKIGQAPSLGVLYTVHDERNSDRRWLGCSLGLRMLVSDTIVQRPSTRHASLLEESVYHLEEGFDGSFWMVTDRGVAHWHPTTDSLQYYLTSDGLPDVRFHFQHSMTKAGDGSMYVSTDGGVFRFDPRIIRPHRDPPHIHLESLVINDQKRIRAPGYQESIELDWFEDNLLFEPIPVTLFRPELAKVVYQMEGYDDRPVEIERGQLIRYVRMPPGRYTFRMQAVDDNGNRSEWLTLPVRIRPPWWQTWWFYTLVTAGLIAAGYGIYRRRIRTLRREEATKRELLRLELTAAENELTALRAQMNPHFLFNVMNSIKSIIITRQTDRAIHYLTQLSQLIRTILANSEKKLITLDRELAALKIYVQLEALRFDDDFNYSVLLGDDVDTDFIKIPPLLLQPFAENAIRHGLVPRPEHRQLKLHIYRDGDFIVCEMEDNGIGRTAAGQQSRARTGHQSMGLDITRRRLKMADERNDFHFVDLTDAEKRPLGTRVVVRVWAPD